MRPQIVIILTFLLGLWSNGVMLAQSQGGSKSPPPPNSQRTPQFPIDDFILPLLILGIAYGCYIMHRRNKRSNTPA